MIGIVILNYFSHKKVHNLLATIPLDKAKLVIVDNSNSIKEFNELIKVKRSDLEYIKANKNGGFSVGTNIGIKKLKSKCKGILILNPDTLLSRNFLENLEKISELEPNFCFSPAGYLLDGKTPWSLGGKFFWLRGRAEPTTKSNLMRKISFGTCACIYLSKKALDSVGFLDEDYFLGGEEWQLSLDLNRLRIPIYFIPFSKYRHEVSGTHEKYGKKYFYIGIRTKVLFCRKNYGLFFFPWLIIFFIFSPLITFRYAFKNKVNLKILIFAFVKSVILSINKYPIKERELGHLA